MCVGNIALFVDEREGETVEVGSIRIPEEWIGESDAVDVEMAYTLTAVVSQTAGGVIDLRAVGRFDFHLDGEAVGTVARGYFRLDFDGREVCPYDGGRDAQGIAHEIVVLVSDYEVDIAVETASGVPA